MNGAALCDFQFKSGDYANYIYIDEHGNDVSLPVRVLDEAFDLFSKWYVISVREEIATKAGLTIDERLTKSYEDQLGGLKAALADPDELELFITQLKVIK